MGPSAKNVNLLDISTLIKKDKRHEASDGNHGFGPLQGTMTMRPQVTVGLNGVEQPLTWITVVHMNVSMLPTSWRHQSLTRQLIQILCREHLDGHRFVAMVWLSEATICLAAISGENNVE